MYLPIDCTALIDVLCPLTTKLEEILDSLNNDEDFLACLFYCLYRLAEERSEDNFSPSPASNSFTGYVPASWIQMKNAANRVFCKVLELKRKVGKFQMYTLHIIECQRSLGSEHFL